MQVDSGTAQIGQMPPKEEVEEQKGAKSKTRGKLTCLFSFLQPDMVCWNLFRWRVRMAGGQKISSCLLAGC